MFGAFVHYYRGFAAAFKSRHTLLVENWELRHQLMAAQQSLMQAGLAHAREALASAVAAEVLPHHRDWRQAFCQKLGFFGPAEPRICLVLIVAALSLLTANTVRSVRTFAPTPAPEDILAELDSFSEAGVAEAVLRRDAQALLIDYTDGYNAYLQRLDNWKRDYANWLVTVDLHDAPESLGCYQSQHPKMPTFATDAWIPRFKAALLSLNERPVVDSLQHCLLLLYERHGLWPEFINLYLDLVRKSPADGDVVNWAQLALTRAKQFGRDDEVAGYLEVSAKFGGDPELAKLSPILERWNEARRKPVPPLALSVESRLPARM